MKKNKDRIYSEKELNRLCRKWQKRLRLQDWKGIVIIEHAKQINCVAHIDAHIYDKTFKIKISTVESVRENNWISEHKQYDMVDCLVHELLHLHFRSVQPEVYDEQGEYTEEYLRFDNGIELTTQALVNLYRKTRSK